MHRAVSGQYRRSVKKSIDRQDNLNEVKVTEDPTMPRSRRSVLSNRSVRAT